MGQSIDFIKDRAVKTIAAATEIQATWTWQEMDVKQMQAKLDAIVGDGDAAPPLIGQEEKAETANQTMLAARGAWDTSLDQLHRWTMQGVGMSKTRFRDDAAKAAQLDGLSASGTSRAVTLKEALAWESAWTNIDAAWAPLPTNTLAAFTALRKSCVEDLQDTYADTRAAWREEAETLNEMAATLEAMNVAWYADATRVFAEGTPEGDMMRGTIPTTYSPAPPSPPPVTP